MFQVHKVQDEESWSVMLGAHKQSKWQTEFMWSQILIWRCRTYYYHQLVSAVYKDSDASPKNHTCSCIQWMYMNNCICSMFKWHEGGHTCILLCNCGLYSHKKVTLNLEEIMECEKLDWLVKTGVTAITQEGLSQFPKLTHHHPGYSCGSHPPALLSLYVDQNAITSISMEGLARLPSCLFLWFLWVHHWSQQGFCPRPALRFYMQNAVQNQWTFMWDMA